jgi:hypothetical protein
LSRFQQEEPAKRPFSLMAVKFNNNFKLQLKDYSILKRNVPLKRYPRSRMDFTGLRHLVDPWVSWELRCPSPICRQHRLVRLSHRKSLIQNKIIIWMDRYIMPVINPDGYRHTFAVDGVRW